MRVVIVGGGIGGLTAALSLHQAGIDVVVHEAVADIKPLGVGINILPHAARELIDLGLEAAVDRIAIRTSAMRYYTHTGQLVISQPCGLNAGYHWPQWSLHRGQLHMLLLRTFEERAGAERVIRGSSLVDFSQHAKGVSGRFKQTGDGQVRSVDCDLLVGADGLHSQVRRQLYPQEGKPLYCGMVLYRAAVESQPFLDGHSMVIVGDKRLRLVAYPITQPHRADQPESQLINWIGVLPMAEQDAPAEDWDNVSASDRLRPRYAHWHFDWLDVPALLSQSSRVLQFPVYDRDPLERWSFDRVTLLGDAAHPLIPVSSSGAVHAIIDGRALAYALSQHRDPREGLQAYEADRLPQANAVIRSSRDNGPDEVLEIVHRRCPEGCRDIKSYVSQTELQAVIDDFKSRTGFAVEALNARPSYRI